MPGLTKLEAINEMLEAVDEQPVPALDTGGSSIEAAAERILDRTSRRVQAQGWPDNTVRSKSLTGANPLALPATTLWVRAAGPDQHRNLVMRGANLYDADKDTGDFSGQTVFVDLVRELTFDDCSPKLKDVIVAHAKLIFQRRQKGELGADGFMSQELAAAEIAADRPKPVPQPPNIQAVLPQAPSSDG